ncbi:RNA recognition motif domain containing protein [Babesia bovis T2Bo]|uniref:U2 small nuclear ribonucleoprotein B', putative n=1 Tax=Babesia bovis TaxID=5865 RepID=A7ANK4_BABBO|nr:RNA recognition motif domain containing protein [Babesia bovis T2Bo]EDO08138.1 RNA recognition motif domain containing protein [Babesia bovis T2Bo]BAN64552.1 U2 small nuclear ribonucleoprotein B', putative [Babesia bovis]|eukprot:XP_001611706.1 U2 small nuclear ribonucleoprotein B' [Babesia bovis T2Bo]
MASDQAYRTGESLPNHTLYVSNLDDRIHVNDLRKLLYEFLIPYGEIVDISARRTQKLRGQAFVSFSEIASAISAFKGVNGRSFLDRPLKVAYARNQGYKSMKPAECYRLLTSARSLPSEQVMIEDTLDANSEGGERHTLFVENLHPDMNKMSVELLFQQYPGYKDTRFVEGKCVAFVDFATAYQGEVALQGLQGFSVSHSHALRISFAKSPSQ